MFLPEAPQKNFKESRLINPEQHLSFELSFLGFDLTSPASTWLKYELYESSQI